MCGHDMVLPASDVLYVSNGTCMYEVHAYLQQRMHVVQLTKYGAPRLFGKTKYHGRHGIQLHCSVPHAPQPLSSTRYSPHQQDCPSGSPSAFAAGTSANCRSPSSSMLLCRDACAPTICYSPCLSAANSCLSVPLASTTRLSITARLRHPCCSAHEQAQDMAAIVSKVSVSCHAGAGNGSSVIANSLAACTAFVVKMSCILADQCARYNSTAPRSKWLTNIATQHKPKHQMAAK